MVKNRRGFTLIETLVSMTILALLLLLVILRFQSINSADRNLRNAAQEVASSVFLAKDYAHSNYDCCSGAPVYGYGIFFDFNVPQKYQIYADRDGDCIYDDPVIDTLMEESKLPQNVSLYSVAPNGKAGYVGNYSGTWSICFPVPYGNILVNNQQYLDVRTGFRYKSENKYVYIDINSQTNKIEVNNEIYETPLD